MERKRKGVVERGDAWIKGKEDVERRRWKQKRKSCCPSFFLSPGGTEQLSQSQRSRQAQTNNFPPVNCNLVWVIYAVKINQLWLNAR